MSEIKQINTGVAEIIAVKVPEGCTSYELPISDILSFKINKGMDYDIVHLPPSNWTPLGIDTELTEEQCRKVMPKSDGWFERYKHGNKFHWSAKEAFASFMQANGLYSKNPLQLEWDEACTYGHGGCSYDEYFAAQANTGTWLILKRLS